MERDPRAFLWDVREAADALLGFVCGRNFDDYVSNVMLRSAVERQFEINGEALNRLRQTDPVLSGRIPDTRRIIGFRSVLIHGYNRISDADVWRTIESDIPTLRAQVAALLTELGEQP